MGNVETKNHLRVLPKDVEYIDFSEGVSAISGQLKPEDEPELTMGDVLMRIISGFQKLFVVLQYKFHRMTFGVFKQVRLPWLKLAAITCVAFLLFKNNLHLEMGYRKPASFFDGDRDKESNINWAQTVSFGSTSDNPFAPASPEDLKEQLVQSYIKRFSKIAVVEKDKFGVPASINIAQGLIESRCGGSILAKKVNNHFGIKCFSHHCKRGHCMNFEDDNHKDFFRMYKSAWESWREHSQMLSSGRYKTLQKYGVDYKRWAHGLKELGYATDPDYDDKLIGIIEKYELYKLDDL